MCGIIAYIGQRQAASILVNGLKRLEYRGYDSAGVGLIVQKDSSHGIHITKKQGKVSNLESQLKSISVDSTLGIAHTRWATHGAPSDVNSHPHVSETCDVGVVHNGIVENFAALKAVLMQEGCVFVSETDTEVLAHLISQTRKAFPHQSYEAVVRLALQHVHGAYGICVLFADAPDLLIGARRGSPLLVGVNDGEYFLASDASAIIEHTKNVEYLHEAEIVTITRAGYSISSLDVLTPIQRPSQVKKLEMNLEAIEKGGYKHFMLKEIMEQPKALAEAFRGRINEQESTLRLGGLEGLPIESMGAAKRIIIAACGTSFHSGLVGEYLIESMARIPVEVEYASEFRYRNPILTPKEDILIVISQSGETADTLAAVNLAKQVGIMTIGLVNVVGSTIARETHAGCYLHVGPEIGVASTKAFTGQVALLAMLALRLGIERKLLSDEQIVSSISGLARIPEQMDQVLQQASVIENLAKSYRFASSFLYLGRGFNFPVALEGALKLKEISYIHAEGYAAAEMKHGPIALIDKFMPVVIIAPPSDTTYDKIRSNVEEVHARGGNVIIITEVGNEDFKSKAEATLYIPKCPEWLSPLLTVVPLQLLSYYIATMRKLDVDQPRNLAKSVTVE